MIFIERINKFFEGLPDIFLTLTLLTLCVFGAIVAIHGSPSMKAVVCAYFLLP